VKVSYPQGQFRLARLQRLYPDEWGCAAGAELLRTLGFWARLFSLRSVVDKEEGLTARIAPWPSPLDP
jgi:hypothetical protein